MNVPVRDTWRALARDSRFSIAALLLLSITIGSVLALFALVDALVLRPFPFADQSHLFVVWQRDDRRATPVVEIAHGEMTDWRKRTRAFENLAVVGSVNWSVTLTGGAEEQPVPLAAVSASFFDVVGTKPLIGRALVHADEDGALPRVMVI